jgi:hypothetical protein
MSDCCNACTETWRLLAIPVDGKDPLRIHIPGKAIAVGDSLQLSVVPIARVALGDNTALRRFRLSVSLADPASALPLVNEAHPRGEPVIPVTFSLVVAADGLLFESLPELARNRIETDTAFIDAVVSLRFDNRETSSVKARLSIAEQADCGIFCPSICHAHWHGCPFFGTSTSCHGPCVDYQTKKCLCEGAKECDGWNYCDCVKPPKTKIVET